MSRTVTPTVPPPGPGFRSRLLRPNRWRLWVQFALLGAFVLVIPIMVSSSLLLHAGRTVLIEHEIIDLSDESNLRVNDFREDMAYLARDVKQLVDRFGGRAMAEAAVLDGLQLPDRPPATDADPAAVRDVRRKHLYGTVVGVFSFPTGKPDVAVLPADSAARTHALRAALADVDARLARTPAVDTPACTCNRPTPARRRGAYWPSRIGPPAGAPRSPSSSTSTGTSPSGRPCPPGTCTSSPIRPASCSSARIR